ncbi:MAG: hypothetical protein E7117_04590 [Bacteroidales bacterium]|nr:hypothetical protein [Bacteroidales bacterium]
MKKFFFITAILAAFTFTSCEKETSKSIVGAWNTVSMTSSYQGVNVSVNLAEMGLSMIFSFDKNGTGTISTTADGSTTSEPITYIATETTLMMTDQYGEVLSAGLTISGKNMTLSLASGDMFDEEGGPVTLHLVKM